VQQAIGRHQIWNEGKEGCCVEEEDEDIPRRMDCSVLAIRRRDHHQIAGSKLSTTGGGLDIEVNDVMFCPGSSPGQLLSRSPGR
jgi:hypothetical protein